MNVREAKLRGIRGASEVLSKLKLYEKIKDGCQQVDVFSCISELGIPVLCRPLKGLLGAYIRAGGSDGILVTSERRPHIQRYTAAHELGHYWLKHSQSFDTETDIRLARMGAAQVALQEIEAEAFASELLLPKQLLVSVLRRKKWSKSDVKKPENIYQLSLRVGASYEATWRALEEHKILSRSDTHIFESTPPRQLKKALLSGIQLQHSWADVYHLDETDSGTSLIASPEDTILIDLEEHVGSGYVWTDVAKSLLPIQKLGDQRTDIANSQAIGSPKRRQQFFIGEGEVELRLEEKRPWDTEAPPSSGFKVSIHFMKSELGLPMVVR